MLNKIKIHYPEDAVDDAVIAGFRLIDDEAQLEKDNLKRTRSRVEFISPGRMSDGQQKNLRIDRVKLKDTLLEILFLEVPFKKLCSNNCKGICLDCGIDLNNEPCSCEN